jgi:hypothetical protein
MSRVDVAAESFTNCMDTQWTISNEWLLMIKTSAPGKRASFTKQQSISLIESINTSGSPPHLLISTTGNKQFAVVAQNFVKSNAPPPSFGDAVRMSGTHQGFFGKQPSDNNHTATRMHVWPDS